MIHIRPIGHRAAGQSTHPGARAAHLPPTTTAVHRGRTRSFPSWAISPGRLRNLALGGSSRRTGSEGFTPAAGSGKFPGGHSSVTTAM